MARFDVVEIVVEDPDAAGPPTGAVSVDNVQDVDRASDVTEVLANTLT